MRNPNGHGSVFKLKGRRRKPYVARVTTGWVPVLNKKGEEVLRQDYQYIGYYETKREALDALTLHRIHPVSPKANITLKELYEEWSAAKYQHISRQTINNYKAAWNYLAALENLKVKEIRTAHLQGVLDKAHKEKKSHSSLAKIRVVAVMLFSYAVENDILTKNYAEYIRLPRYEKVPKDRFTDLEIRQLFDHAADPWITTVLIMIYTGMRISELLELTRFNVDLEEGALTGGLKTEAGKNRVIPIHPKILQHIQAWYNLGGDRLICDENKKGFTAKRYRETKYYPALETAGVRKLVPHACRHTFGSLMAAAGVDTISIQKIIGHSSYSTTADIYTHLEIETLKSAIRRI